MNLQIVWRARHLGLGQALARHYHEHEKWPELDLGSMPQWLRLWQTTSRRIRKMRNQWRGATVVCAGNGPSINDMDLSCLENAKVIGTNRSYMMLDRFHTKDFHLLVQDSIRLRELSEPLSKLTCPMHLGSCFMTEEWAPPEWLSAGKKNCSVYMPKVEWEIESDRIRPISDFEPGFSEDPTKFVSYGFSVIFSAIQFAAYFGAKRIVCIGIDMDYSKGESFVAGVPSVWGGFNYETHALPNFNHFRETLQQRGIELINSTPGGKVDAIERMPLEQAMANRNG